MKYDSQIKDKSNIKNMKEFVKSRQNINKTHKKVEKFDNQFNRFNSKKSSEKNK